MASARGGTHSAMVLGVISWSNTSLVGARLPGSLAETCDVVSFHQRRVAGNVYLNAREKQEDADSAYAASEDGMWKTKGVLLVRRCVSVRSRTYKLTNVPSLAEPRTKKTCGSQQKVTIGAHVRTFCSIQCQ